MNEDNLDNVKLADRIVDNRLLSEGTIGGPWNKTTLVKLNELNDLRVPADSDVEPVRRGSRILKVHHVNSKAPTNRSGNCAEGFILVCHQRLISTVTHAGPYWG
jgi:hypothetical protein